MPLTRLFPERLHRIVRELTSFGIIGVANTILDFAIFNGLIFLGPLKANIVSTAVATTTSYAMNLRWTYRDRRPTTLHRQYPLFFAVNLIGLGIQELVLGLAKYGLGFHESDSRLALNLFKCFAVGVAMVFRFWAYRTFVFRPHPGPVAAAQPVEVGQPVEVAQPVAAAQPVEVARDAELIDAELELDAELVELEFDAETSRSGATTP